MNDISIEHGLLMAFAAYFLMGLFGLVIGVIVTKVIGIKTIWGHEMTVKTACSLGPVLPVMVFMVMSCEEAVNKLNSEMNNDSE